MHDRSRLVAPKPRVSDFTSTAFELRSLALLRRYQSARTTRRQVVPPVVLDLRSEWIDPMAFRKVASIQEGGHCHG